MNDLSNILNKAQKQAVESFEGPHLIVAGAGTGKTRVLEYRVVELVKKGVDPSNILLLTFTRRTASEMIARASRHNPQLRRISGGTFHSFALRTLKKYAKNLGLENSFTIIDRADSEDLVAKVIDDLKVPNKRYFPKKNTIADIISKSINKEKEIDELLEKEYPHLLEHTNLIELIRMKYRKYKQARDVFDYDDLLVNLLLLLEKDQAVRERIGERYQFVMVDEYQDTNKLQAKIVYQLARNHHNVLIVGDEMQSIYAFRGANFENMIEFPQFFKNAKKITLEENYRSTQEILDVANAVLEQVEGPVYKKYLQSDRNGPKPSFHMFKSPKEEAFFICKKILELRKKGVPLSGIAVLFRAAYQSASLEIELTRLGIPFKKYGGIRFVETAHIKDVLSYLKVIENPKDDLAWRRILILLEGIGEKTAENIIRTVLLGSKGQSFKTSNRELGKLFEMLKRIKDEILTPSEKISEVVDYYTPIVRRQYDDYPQREPDLATLIEIALGYETTEEMLADFVLEPPEKSAAGFIEEKGEDEHMTLSTVHSAKGLEWDTVFIIQAQEGKFPSIRAMESQKDIEEERRLFYVAVTRAKQHLFITTSGSNTRGFYNSWNINKMSRFVEPLLSERVLDFYNNVPQNNHYGGFGYHRKKSEFEDLLDEQISDDF